MSDCHEVLDFYPIILRKYFSWRDGRIMSLETENAKYLPHGLGSPQGKSSPGRFPDRWGRMRDGSRLLHSPTAARTQAGPEDSKFILQRISYRRVMKALV
jgi:hypothetical protein